MAMTSVKKALDSLHVINWLLWGIAAISDLLAIPASMPEMGVSFSWLSREQAGIMLIYAALLCLLALLLGRVLGNMEKET